MPAPGPGSRYTTRETPLNAYYAQDAAPGSPLATSLLAATDPSLLNRIGPGSIAPIGIGSIQLGHTEVAAPWANAVLFPVQGTPTWAGRVSGGTHTFDATPEILFIGPGPDRLTVPDAGPTSPNYVMCAEFHILAGVAGNSQAAYMVRRIIAGRTGSGGANVTQIGSTITVGTDINTITGTPSVTVTADNTDKAIIITVTGVAFEVDWSFVGTFFVMNTFSD